MAGIGNSVGYGSRSAMLGALGGGIAGLAIGAVVGGTAGLLGGLFGKSQATRAAQARIKAQLEAYRDVYREAVPTLDAPRSAFLVEEMPGDRVTREMVDADGGYWLHPPMVTFAADRARRIRGVRLLDPDTTGPTFHPVAGRAL